MDPTLAQYSISELLRAYSEIEYTFPPELQSKARRRIVTELKARSKVDLVKFLLRSKAEMNNNTMLVNLWFAEVIQDSEDKSPENIQSIVTNILEMEGYLPETGILADIMNEFLKKVNWDHLSNCYSED